MKRILPLLCMLAAAGISRGQNPCGVWSGELEAGPQTLRIVFRIEPSEDGYTAVMDSPTQGAEGLPVHWVDVRGDTLVLGMPTFGALYRGVMQADTLISGAFNQWGTSLPLELRPGAGAPGRPQEPHPPYPYESRDVVFNNGGVVLSGTFTRPRGRGAYPAVVLVSGSGAQDRDETILGHKPFLVLSDLLTRRGIAVLRYDDRGMGGSSGPADSATTADNLRDALAAFDFLSGLDGVDSRRVGILGHSEGGTIAFMAAARSPKVAFIVTLAAAAVRGDSLLVMQNRGMLLDNGVPDETVEKYCGALRRVLDIKRGKSPEYIAAHLEELEEIALPAADSLPPEMRGNLSALLSTHFPWMDYFIAYDPAQDISAVRCPVFALGGDKDVQVDAGANLGAIRRGLSEAGNRSFVVKEYPGLNHLFQHCSTGDVSEYERIEETMSPEVMDDIADWILKAPRRARLR